ncbi:uncharacterized protein LOC123316936 [Coccinella septempunctata]|uniref:uncharacterized protein LOC123316936 n=1 Tax=Coccinella septempunctata TaxID=41139 RepID=UPI001D0638CE|nr:uncharacterized protein LOC123316936 [Coccinella septempunctata]
MNVAVSCDFVLTHMLLSRLDPETSRAFEREHGSTAIPEYNTLFQFLEEYCNGLINSNTTVYAKSSPNKYMSNSDCRKRNSFITQTKSKNPKCALCQSDHPTYTCVKYLEKAPRERHIFCRNHHLCFGCLSSLHNLKSCKSTSACKKCNSKNHHTTLHFDREHDRTDATASAYANGRNLESPSDQDTPSMETQRSLVLCSAASPVSRSQVLLCTALVEIKTGKGNFKQFRAVLDSGSEISIVSQRCFSALNIRSSPCSTVINGIGNESHLQNIGEVELSIRSIGSDDPLFVINANVLPKICGKLPSSKITTQSWHYLDKLKLADPKYYCPGDIDVLLGADVFSKILLNNHIQGQNGGPDALHTVFGYVLIGKINTASTNSVHTLFCGSHCDMNASMKSFFDLESVPEFDNGTETDVCEVIFRENYYRNEEGRYVVPLPFKETSPLFPGSRDLAVQRFLSLESRLLKNPSLYKEYCSVMREYL